MGKVSSRADPGNYRPVSLTSIVGKLLGFFINQAVRDHLLQNDLTSPRQHLFLPGRPCESQMLCCIDQRPAHLDKDEPLEVIYLDVQMAFNAVPHTRLMLKLQAYGVAGKC